MKTEPLSRSKQGKRVYLNDEKTRNLANNIDEFFESEIIIPRIQVGNKQTINTLVNEEALLLVKILRDELKIWLPSVRITE